MKSVFITGADRGIGFALCKCFLKDGWLVFAGRYMEDWPELDGLKQDPREDLEKIIEADAYASNAGGGQRSMIIGIRNAELVEKLGRMNMAHFAFYTQGDYGLFQCSGPCCQETFENGEIVRRMMGRQEDMHVPSELLPVCPHCGKPMTMNLRSDNRFVEDEGWHKAARRYEDFLGSVY